MNRLLAISGVVSGTAALLWCLLGPVFPARAQQAVFIPPEGSVFSYPSDTVSIFGDVINGGRFGTARNAVINFTGRRWQNAPFSLLPGADGAGTPGGTFRFLGNTRQLLAGGYNINGAAGPSFPNLSIENGAGIQLEDLNDLYIRNNLHFSSGHLYLNGWNMLVGDSITGYSPRGFVVTGTAVGGGYLYRKPSAEAGLLVFPIGPEDNRYAPAGLTASVPFRGITGARVFDHVYQKLTAGQVLDSDYVKETWQLAAVQGARNTRVLLQHDGDDEGIRFAPYRDSSYISRYSLAANQWDIDTLDHGVYGPGMLTTAGPKNNTYMNDRTFPGGLPAETADSVSWLGISAAAYSHITCPVADFKLWVAQRYNYRWVQLFWRTWHELNVAAYEVQRRRDTAATFKTIATLDSKGSGGFSDHLLYYYYADDNMYDGWTEYRLKMTSASGCVVYTSLQDTPWGIGISVWPNPSPGETHVRVTGIKHPIVMRLVDTWGQVLRSYTISRDGIIDINDLSDAVYYLAFYDPKSNNRRITTVKLVVQHVR